MSEYTEELEAKRMMAEKALGKTIVTRQKELKAATDEVERLTGERKTAMQDRKDIENSLIELHEDLVKLVNGGFPERLFPHAGSEPQFDNTPTAPDDAPKRGRKRKDAPAEIEVAQTGGAA